VNHYSFEILGNPVPQGRPRAYRRGKLIGVYDPKNSREWKNYVKTKLSFCENKPVTPIDTAIKVRMIFYFLKPKSKPKKVVSHTVRPDLSNCIKAIEDAMNGIIYTDDSRIISLLAEKYYGERPGVKIDVWRI